MKKQFLLFLLLFISGVHYAQAWTIELSEDELQEKISRALPIEKNKLLFTIVVSSIDVELKEGSDRVGLIADMEIKTPHLSTGKGQAYIDGKLAYNKADGSFYFHESEVKQISFENVPDKYQEVVRSIFQRAIRRRLAKTPVYQLKQNTTKHQIARTLLKSVKVIDQKLILELGLL